MAFLGKLKRNEEIPITLTFNRTPTGTPTYRILNSSRTEIVSATALSGSGLNWYKIGQNVGAAAAVGSYLVEYEAVVDGATRYAYDTYEVTVNEIDDLPAAIDATLTAAHGSGSWQPGGAGTGAYVATINVKDDLSVDVPDAKVTIHNSSNDAAPLIAGPLTTDNQGDATFNIDGVLYVRVKKAGFNFPATQISVTGDGTYNVSGTNVNITPPADPELSRCFISVYDINGTLVTAGGVELVIKKYDTKSKDSSNNFHTDTGITMAYDATNEVWYADIIKGTHVKITSLKVFGKHDDGTLIDREFIVGTGSTTDLGTIRIS